MPSEAAGVQCIDPTDSLKMNSTPRATMPIAATSFNLRAGGVAILILCLFAYSYEKPTVVFDSYANVL
jgi:hypothetical protein